MESLALLLKQVDDEGYFVKDNLLCCRITDVLLQLHPHPERGF